jgi:hypothetical protein
MVRSSKLGRSYTLTPSPILADRLWVLPSIICDGNMGSFSRVKLPEREAHDSSAASVQVKYKWRYTFTPPILYTFIKCTGTILSVFSQYFNQLHILLARKI